MVEGCFFITCEYDSSDLKENGTIPFYRRFFRGLGWRELR